MSTIWEPPEQPQSVPEPGQKPERKIYGPLDPPEKKVRKGGAPVWLTVTLALLCLAMVLVSGVLAVQNSGLATQNAVLESSLADSRSAVQTLGIDLQHKETQISDLLTHNIEIQGELSFWQSNAVIVTLVGEKYHAYGCPTIQNSSIFQIYNVKSAETLGYEPCSQCIDDTLSEQSALDRLAEWNPDGQATRTSGNSTPGN